LHNDSEIVTNDICMTKSYGIIMMYNIHSFDTELIKLHTRNGTRNFYQRKHRYSDTIKRYKFLLRIRKKAIIFHLFKLGRDLFER